MRIIECTQGTPEWFEARRGIPTASNFKRILTPKTGKLSASAQDYIYELIAERYHLGAMDELATPATVAMQNGTIMEPEARRWYELEAKAKVEQVGFIVTDDGRFGCSPDGLVGDGGGLELKCPMGKTHLGYLHAGELPDDYKAQVHGCMIVTGRQWWDFMSYAPGLPAFRIRAERDDYTALLADALDAFDKRLNTTITELALPPIDAADIPESSITF